MKNRTYKFASVMVGISFFSLLFFIVGWISSAYFTFHQFSKIATNILALSPEQSTRFMDYLYQFGGIILRKLV